MYEISIIFSDGREYVFARCKTAKEADKMFKKAEYHFASVLRCCHKSTSITRTFFLSKPKGLSSYCRSKSVIQDLTLKVSHVVFCSYIAYNAD